MASKRTVVGGAATGTGKSDASGERRYWLMKSEPSSFSFADLMAAPARTTCWDGVRNFQARNFMRDDMRVGDGVLFYHSGAEPPAVAGIAEVARAAYPDHTAFDRDDSHYDPKSRRESPTWFMVDVRAVEPFAEPVTLAELRGVPGLEGMMLLQRGSRLSVQPVRPEEWEIVVEMGRKRRVSGKR
ncbi:MAG TPA: EVE domain-containing protein [Gemmatimonadaceae bacterium]|nr:EVE domain-containing protein [Gemmatimonadaceae bacterium]